MRVEVGKVKDLSTAQEQSSTRPAEGGAAANIVSRGLGLGSLQKVT